jgi:hypothetical protein
MRASSQAHPKTGGIAAGVLSPLRYQASSSCVSNRLSRSTTKTSSSIPPAQDQTDNRADDREKPERKQNVGQSHVSPLKISSARSSLRPSRSFLARRRANASILQALQQYRRGSIFSPEGSKRTSQTGLAHFTRSGIVTQPFRDTPLSSVNALLFIDLSVAAIAPGQGQCLLTTFFAATFVVPFALLTLGPRLSYWPLLYLKSDPLPLGFHFRRCCSRNLTHLISISRRWTNGY